MPSNLTNIHLIEGPLLSVTVRLAAYRLLGLKFATGNRSQHARLLIDTGSSVSCLDGSIIEYLGLAESPTGIRKIFTPDSSEAKQMYTFDVELHFRDTHGSEHTIGSQSVCSGFFDDRGYKGVLGRDILKNCAFSYWGPDREFSLEYLPAPRVSCAE